MLLPQMAVISFTGLSEYCSHSTLLLLKPIERHANSNVGKISVRQLNLVFLTGSNRCSAEASHSNCRNIGLDFNGFRVYFVL